jgi:hypothetical protein
MIFARTADDKLAALVNAIDKKVADNQDKKMASFVNFLGADADKAKAAAKAFGEKAKAANVAYVVPESHANGPTEYKINSAADVTVLIYTGGKVEANHAVKAGGLTKEVIKQIVDDTAKILK